MRSAFTTHARNCLDGYMLLPVAPEAFVNRTASCEDCRKPEWLEAKVTKEAFEGSVYSLLVPPHHFYVSGGAIVHNSVKGAQWKDVTVVMAKEMFPFEKRVRPEDPPPSDAALARMEIDRKTERQLAYVAETRASENLSIMCPQINCYGKEAGVSSFVAESGLKLGQNVEGGATTDEPTGKVVLAHFSEENAYEDLP